MTYLTQAPNSIVVLHGQQAETYVRALRAPSKPKAHTVADAINQWLDYLRGSATRTTCRQNRLFISAFARDQRIESKPLASVTEANVSAWVNEGVKLGSRRVRLAIVRSFFKFAAIRGLVVLNPSLLARVDWNSVSHENKESFLVEPFSDADYQKMLSHLESQIAICADHIGLSEKKKSLKFWLAACVISRESGLRFGDICQIESACFATGSMVVWSDKRNRRVVPHILNSPLFDRVTAEFRSAGRKYLFQDQRDTYQNPSARCSLNAAFKRLCVNAGLAQTRFHAWRYAYSCACLRAGIEMPHISTSMGHASIFQTQHYAESAMKCSNPNVPSSTQNVLTP